MPLSFYGKMPKAVKTLYSFHNPRGRRRDQPRSCHVNNTVYNYHQHFSCLPRIFMVRLKDNQVLE
jgi:hypothetical protein